MFRETSGIQVAVFHLYRASALVVVRQIDVSIFLRQIDCQLGGNADIIIDRETLVAIVAPSLLFKRGDAGNSIPAFLQFDLYAIQSSLCSLFGFRFRFNFDTDKCFILIPVSYGSVAVAVVDQ